jgi:hypothetical protein
MKKVAFVLVLVAGLVAPDEAFPQGGPGFLFRTPRVSAGLRVGYQLPRASSNLFDDVRAFYTLSRSDFGALHLGGEVAVRVRERWDVALGVGWARSSSQSEYRDWVDEDRLPIEQETVFERFSGTAGAKYYLARRGRTIGRFAWVPARFAPYVGGGVGFTYYEFEQFGDFVALDTCVGDPPACDIVYDRLLTTGTGAAAYAAAGADFSLGKQFVLTSEARYHLGSGPMRGPYRRFDRIDLSGLQLTAGVAVRW